MLFGQVEGVVGALDDGIAGFICWVNFGDANADGYGEDSFIRLDGNVLAAGADALGEREGRFSAGFGQQDATFLK